MITGGLKGGQFKILSSDEIYDVHVSTLEVLEKTGVRIRDEKVLKLLDDSGAEVDFREQKALIPQYMVREAVKKAPSTLRLCGRKRENDLRLEDKRVYLGTGGTALYVLDMDTGERRKSTSEDLKKFAILVENLENIHFFMHPVFPHDVPSNIAGPYRFYIGLRFSTKHVFGGVYRKEDVFYVKKMAELVVGGEKELTRKPLISVITCVACPLSWDKNYVQILLEAAKEKIPVIISSEPLAGGTGPATLAGCLVQQNAESLSGVVLTQLVNPGTPVIYGTVASILDPKFGGYSAGAIEQVLLNTGAAQMSQFYRLPIYATGGMTDSKIPDIQAGYEKSMITTLVALSGANLIHDAAGLIDSALTYSYEMTVIDDEIIGMIMRVMNGIKINNETLAVDVINDVGPGGHFLAHKHTRKHFRKELFFPKISDRRKREEWERTGRKDASLRAKEKVKEILDKAKFEPLPKDIEKEMEDLIKKAGKGEFK